jgi:hypothetical protein
MYTSNWVYTVWMPIDYLSMYQGENESLVNQSTTVNLNPYTPSKDSVGIELNNIVSAQNNQIKNVVEPTRAQDAVTKSYLDSALEMSQAIQDAEIIENGTAIFTLVGIITSLKDRINALENPPSRVSLALDHTTKTLANETVDGFRLGLRFSVNFEQKMAAVGAWEGWQPIISKPIVIFENGIIISQAIVDNSGFINGNSRFVDIDDITRMPGKDYYILGNYEGLDLFGSFSGALLLIDSNSRINPVNSASSLFFSINTDGDISFPANLATKSTNSWWR